MAIWNSISCSILVNGQPVKEYPKNVGDHAGTPFAVIENYIEATSGVNFSIGCSCPRYIVSERVSQISVIHNGELIYGRSDSGCKDEQSGQISGSDEVRPRFVPKNSCFHFGKLVTSEVQAKLPESGAIIVRFGCDDYPDTPSSPDQAKESSPSITT